MRESLVGDTYKFEQVSYAFGMSFLNPSAFHARSYYEEQLVQSFIPSPQSFEHAPTLCNSCQSFYHDTNYCPHVILWTLDLNNLSKN